MLRFLRDTEPPDFWFCDRCASVCDRRCQADELRRQTLLQALLYGHRLV
ncbi:MAG: hypothetical protein ACXVZL_03190 [Gaiellaceae bacterium]